MKKILLIATAMIFFATVVVAQMRDTATDEEAIKKVIEGLNEHAHEDPTRDTGGYFTRIDEILRPEFWWQLVEANH